ncbi:MAG: hypothetical protein AB7S49_04045 [Arcobacter sp.]|uniref:hypothetical protein n=1 Tax=Arcobacter sp. TaxID=1872629 RepID=UPI003D068301
MEYYFWVYQFFFIILATYLYLIRKEDGLKELKFYTVCFFIILFAINIYLISSKFVEINNFLYEEINNKKDNCFEYFECKEYFEDILKDGKITQFEEINFSRILNELNEDKNLNLLKQEEEETKMKLKKDLGIK